MYCIYRKIGSNEDIFISTFSWPPLCEKPEWLIAPSVEDKPRVVWLLEMTDGNSPSGRIPLDRFVDYHSIITISIKCNFIFYHRFTLVFGSNELSSYENIGFRVVISGSSIDKIENNHCVLLLNPNSLTKSKQTTGREKLEFHIMDLNTESGTRVNGNAIESGKPVALKVGDKFSLGTSRRSFRLMRCQISRRLPWLATYFKCEFKNACK